MSEWVNYFGEICKGKNGGDYIKVKKDFVGKKGNVIRMIKFEDDLQGMVDRGKMTEEQKKTRLEQIHWVKYILHVPPQDKTEPDNYTSKTGWINDAIELRKSREGSLYLHIAHDFEAKAGTYLTLIKYADRIKDQHQRGFLSDEDLKKKEEVSEWLCYIVSIPPLE